MKDEIEELSIQMEQARQTLEALAKEKQAIDNKRRETYRKYYIAKDAINRIKAQTNV